MIPWFNIKFPALGPIQIHMFGILVATGILVGTRLTQRRGRQLGLSNEMVGAMCTVVVVCGILFSHVFDVFAYQTFGKNPSLWEILNPFGGLSSFGGFIGAVGTLFWWTRRHKQPVMPYADSLAFGLAFGWTFGRFGCFTAHDHPGRTTDFFLAVQYPSGTRHDLGLDEALWSLGVSILFLILQRRNRPLGIYVTILTLAYAPVRFVLDFLRTTDLPGADPRYFGLTPGQYGSLLVFLIGLGLARWTIQHHNREVAPVA